MRVLLLHPALGAGHLSRQRWKNHNLQADDRFGCGLFQPGFCPVLIQPYVGTGALFFSKTEAMSESGIFDPPSVPKKSNCSTNPADLSRPRCLWKVFLLSLVFSSPGCGTHRDPALSPKAPRPQQRARELCHLQDPTSAAQLSPCTLSHCGMLSGGLV